VADDIVVGRRPDDDVVGQYAAFLGEWHAAASRTGITVADLRGD
jgi:hypothetical protein